MRGKAHVVFRDVAAATQAMRALQGWVFLGQALVSDAWAAEALGPVADGNRG